MIPLPTKNEFSGTRKQYRIITIWLAALLCLTANIRIAKSAELFWHASAVTLGFAAITLSYQEQQKYNELLAKDEDLNDDYRNATSTAELRRIDKEHDDNLEQLDQYKQTMVMYNNITIVAVIWELYLLISNSGSNRSAGLTKEKSDGLVPQIALQPNWQLKHYSLDLTWKF